MQLSLGDGSVGKELALKALRTQVQSLATMQGVVICTCNPSPGEPETDGFLGLTG